MGKWFCRVKIILPQRKITLSRIQIIFDIGEKNIVMAVAGHGILQ